MIIGKSDGGIMGTEGQEALLKEMQVRLNRKLREQELDVVAYWREQLARILALKPEGVGALQNQIRKVAEMMDNRIAMLKKSPRD